MDLLQKCAICACCDYYKVQRHFNQKIFSATSYILTSFFMSKNIRHDEKKCHVIISDIEKFYFHDVALPYHPNFQHQRITKMKIWHSLSSFFLLMDIKNELNSCHISKQIYVFNHQNYHITYFPTSRGVENLQHL